MKKILTLFFLLAASSASAQTNIPDTAVGSVFSKWMLMFESADRAGAEAFQQRYGGDPVEDILDYRTFSGGLELLRIEQSDHAHLSALMRERSARQADVRVTLELESGGVQRLKVLKVEPQPIARIDQSAALAALSGQVSSLAAQDRFSGAWLIARDGKILRQGGVGLADREARVSNTPETRFRMVALSKMFTAVAVLQLVDTGKLSLDSTVGEVLHDYPNREVAGRVRLRHLLSHTSGVQELELGALSGSDAAASQSGGPHSHDDYIKHYGARGLSFEPGSKMAYSNYGFELLARIIEVASGQSYEAYLAEHVFVPAGMASTGFEPGDVVAPGCAVSYTSIAGQWQPVPNKVLNPSLAGGRGYTTVGDLFRFAQALQSGRLLSPERFAQATTPQGDISPYGFGFLTVGDGALRRYGNFGGLPGASTDFRIFPESGYVLISISNIDPPSAHSVIRFYEPRMPVTR